jgi:GT2 family glycosyltransferase
MTPPPAARVTVVTVSYNSLHVVPHMLGSVPKEASVVIVDNASVDTEPLAALCAEHGVRLVRNARNLGFGVACNLGAEGAKTEFLLFLNPDAALMPDTLDRLVAAADCYPAASAFNPRIAESDGTPFFKRKSYLMPRAEWMPRGWPESDREVSVLSGAALFVRRKYFEKVGGFDPGIFLFHEDDDLALRLKAECGPLMFIRDALVQHVGGSSSARSAEIAALKAWHMGHSRVYAARKHHRPWARTHALIQAALQLVSPVVLVSRRKRAKQVAFLGGIVHASLGGSSITERQT